MNARLTAETATTPPLEFLHALQCASRVRPGGASHKQMCKLLLQPEVMDAIEAGLNHWCPPLTPSGNTVL